MTPGKTDDFDKNNDAEEDIFSVLMPSLMPFETVYDIGQVLGEGGFGTVYSGVRLRDGLPVAIKQVAKVKVKEWRSINNHRVPLEIYLMCKVAHIDGCIKILEFFEKTDSFIIIMERPEPAQDLYDYITAKGILEEHLARDYFRQIVKTVIACHQAGVVHRDIKDENIVVNLKSQCLKLIDFGSRAILRETFVHGF
ncbi:Serine/threonine-protein kinase pim-3 [Orchesella cincta]|uniref:Serine/threonine-protein kinase 1 n=1 Tax=Orchesella cincta TaxID=48709 RepID=A0A1D2M3B5_ORCCI|nr:Serine/threonine-protein kinase pim-3 [Orchesella cincta]